MNLAQKIFNLLYTHFILFMTLSTYYFLKTFHLTTAKKIITIKDKFQKSKNIEALLNERQRSRISWPKDLKIPGSQSCNRKKPHEQTNTEWKTLEDL